VSSADRAALDGLMLSFKRALPRRLLVASPFVVVTVLFGAQVAPLWVPVAVVAGLLTLGPALVLFRLRSHRVRLVHLAERVQEPHQVVVRIGRLRTGVTYAAQVWTSPGVDRLPDVVYLLGDDPATRGFDGRGRLWGEATKRGVALLEVDARIVWPVTSGLGPLRSQLLMGRDWEKALVVR
jgi:hypothetical protein